AVLVAINPRLAAGEILYILNDAQAAAVIADPALRANLPELPAKCPALRADLSYKDLLALGAEHEVAYEIEDEDALISLNYTSGTGGHLKGVMYTHRGAYLNALGN